MFEEFLIVISHSTRTLVAIVVGLVLFSAILLIGANAASELSFEGPLAPLTETIREIVFHHYEKAAFGALFAFGGLAVRFYRKDRKRLFY